MDARAIEAWLRLNRLPCAAMKQFWEIADKQGIDVDVPGFDYEGFARKRQAELSARQAT